MLDIPAFVFIYISTKVARGVGEEREVCQPACKKMHLNSRAIFMLLGQD